MTLIFTLLYHQKDCNIGLVEQNDIQHLIDASVKEGILPSNNVQYMVLEHSDIIQSIGGFIIKGNTALFKGDYTPIENRKNGYGEKLLRARMLYVTNYYAVNKITAHCTPMSINLYKRLGFQIVRTYKNGIISVQFILSPQYANI
jgi:hypothetical protein